MNLPPILPQQTREGADPVEHHHPVPFGVLAVVLALLIFGVVYIVQSDLQRPSSLGDSRSADEWQVQGDATAQGRSGAAIYASLCLACHQATGKGLPGVFPPLAGSEWVLGQERTLIAILLHGINGPIEVAGQPYSGAMPSFGAQLSDAELASLLTHLRTQWGHQAAKVSASQVAEVRAATKDRTAPFEGGKALLAVP